MISRAAILPFAVLMGVVAPTWGQMRSPAEHGHRLSTTSTTLSVTVHGKTTTMSVTDLDAMPQKSVTVRNAHTQADETYTGVTIADLLAKLGVPYEGNEKEVYHSYLRAGGSDGYWVVFSASELETAVHTGDVIVATKVGGQALGADGAFRLVDSGDRKPARWVRNLATLELRAVE